VRIPLGDLRAAVANPSNYAKNYNPGKRDGGPSKYSMFLHAIGEYHKTNDVNRAQDYLDEKLKNFKDFKDLPEYVEKLDKYAKEFKKQGNALVRYRDLVSVPVPPQYSQFTVTGQASRVDLVPSGGYAIWMFVRGVSTWEEDPRMPLIHFTYSQTLAVPLQEISVGVYDFESGEYDTCQYDSSDVKKARTALRKVLAELEGKFSSK
jgi:hypothetical protein